MGTRDGTGMGTRDGAGMGTRDGEVMPRQDRRAVGMQNRAVMGMQNRAVMGHRTRLLVATGTRLTRRVIYAGQVDATTVRKSGNSCSDSSCTTWDQSKSPGILGVGTMPRGCRALPWAGGSRAGGAGEDLGFASQPLRKTKTQAKSPVNPDFNLL